MPNEPPTSEGERAALIAQVSQQVSREDAEAKAALKRATPTSRRAMLALWALLGANVVAWVVFPPHGPPDADRRSAAQVEADLRLGMGSAAANVESWRADHGGALPQSLNEASVTDSTFLYSRSDNGTFELRASVGDLSLTYRSSTPLAEFVVRPVPRR